MKPGWRRFLDVLRIAIGLGAKHAKKPVVRDVLSELEQVTPDMIEDVVTPPQTPKAKHRGLK